MSDFFRQVIDQVGQFIFNLQNAWYEEDGNPLPQTDVMDVLNARIDDVSQVASYLARAVDQGDMSVNDWRQTYAVELRRVYAQSYALGRGGWEQMTPDDQHKIYQMLVSEFGYLNQFARQIQDGNLSEAEILRRMNMYANGLQKAYWEGNRTAKIEAGYTKERRIINAKESCPDCIGYADQGWVEIDTLPAPGIDSQCLSNCACEMEFQQ